MKLDLLRKATVGASLALMIASVSVGSVQAKVINTTTPNLVFDSFDSKFKTPNPTANQSYWWRTLKSGSPSGFSSAENVDCNFDACLTKEKQDGETFARLSLKPQQYPGSIMVSDLTEERNGFGYSLPHRWLPTSNHPVVISARLRYSDTYKADGTGSAVGSSPFWMWNNPLGPTGYIAPIRAFGFNWTDSQTFGGFYSGFKATVTDNTVSLNPVYSVDLPTVNMNDWFVATSVWSVDDLGVQHVTFLINENIVGTTALTSALPALTLEFSADNQSAQIGLDGSYQINFRNPSTQQNVDVDFMTLAKL